MNFKTSEKNGSVTGFCLIRTCEKKVTAKGLPYLDMVLADSTGEISAKFWDYNEQAHSGFKADDIIKIKGTIIKYNDNEQLRVEKIRAVAPEDGVNIADFVPSADCSGENMFAELKRITAGFADRELAMLVDTLLDENREKLLFWPAAFRLHHAMRGGLLYHTLSIVRLAECAAKLYPFVDSDLLLAGAILHDIAKTTEYEVGMSGIASGYSVDGALIGHLVRGAMMVEKASEKLGISKEKSMLVEHMLISHHGEPEFGAASRPMFIEAEILSQLDLMDARIYEMAQTVSAVSPGEFSARQWALDNRKLYNHGRMSVEPKAKLFD